MEVWIVATFSHSQSMGKDFNIPLLIMMVAIVLDYFPLEADTGSSIGVQGGDS